MSCYTYYNYCNPPPSPQNLLHCIPACRPPLRSIVVSASARGAIPQLHHTKDVKTGIFVLLSLALGINE